MWLKGYNTSMVEKEKKLNLSELVDVKFLQDFQDIFARTTNVASIMVDDNGPITKPSNFTDFCIKHTRGSSLGYKRCNECDIECGKIAARTGEPAIYTCHSGLTDFAVPIIVKGEHIGSILGGQVLTAPPDEEHYRRIARELGIDEEEYINALRKIKIVPLESVKAAADLLFFVATTISDISLKNIELSEKNERENFDRRITEAIRSSTDIEEFLSFICQETAKIFKVQRAAISVFSNPESIEKFVLRKEYKESEELLGLERIDNLDPISRYWEDALFDTDKVLAIKNMAESDTPEFFKGNYTKLGIKSMLGIGIGQDKKIWGKLILSDYNNYRQWTNDEINQLKIISNQIYIALNQAELYATVQKTAKNERVLREIMLSTVSNFDIKEVIKSIITEVGQLFKADRCFFVGIDIQTSSNRPIKDYAEYLSSQAIKSHTLHAPSRAETEVFIKSTRQKRVVAVDDINKIDLPKATREMLVNDLSVKSYLFAPIFYGNALYGSIVLHYVNDFKHFTQDEIELAQSIANQSAIVIHQATLYSTIEKNEKYTRTIMDSIKDGIITIDDDFVIKSCNPATESIWGHSAPEILGKNLDLLVHHECGSQSEKTCLSARTSFGIKKSGEEFPIEIDVSEILFEDEKLTLLVIRDVTERKKIEKMKNEFISTVSHELRTPLTSIKGALGLVTSGALGVLPDKINNLINIANSNCTRLTNLINDILDLEKIKAGKYEFKNEELEINSIIEQSVTLNQSYADQFGMKLNVINSVEDTYISADKNRILQVMSNLISNAVKFSKLGGEVTIVSEPTDDKIKISVIDNGIGIPEDSKGKIFKSFSQVDSSDTRSKGGTGLGLSISKLIIEKMGGAIGFNSEETKGSTFFFIVPTIAKGATPQVDDGTVKELGSEIEAW